MKHKPKYFYRIFLPFVLVGAMAMMLFNGFAFLFTKSSFEEKIILEKQENVVQTMNTLEQKLQALDYSFNSYIHDTTFKTYIRQPLTVKQFDTYRLINTQINYISSFGPSQTTAVLVSLQGNWIINEHGLQELKAEEREKITSTYLSLPNSSTWLKDEQDHGKIKLVKQTPFYQKTKNGVLIIDVPLKSFSNLIYKSSDSSPIFIYSQEGKLIYQSNSAKEDPINEDMISSLISRHHEQTGVFDVDFKGEEKYQVAYSKSAYNGWIYVSTVNDSEFAQAMKPTLIGTVLMSVFVLIVTIIIAYVSSDYFSKPIRELQKFIPNMQKDGNKDEFEQIGNSIRAVMDKNHSLENIVTNQHEQLKTLFMLHLFHGRMNQTEIKEELQDFSYPQQWSCLYVLAIQFDSLENSQYTRKDKDLLLFSVNQIVAETIGKAERFTPTVIDSKTQATIFICQDNQHDQHVVVINQYAEKIQKKINEIFNLTISIGVSSAFESLVDSKQALAQGVDSLKYRLKVGKEAIIFYESVAAIFNNRQINTYFPKMLENQLFDHIKLGETEKAKEVLHLLLADLFKHGNNPNQLEVNIMRFLNDLMTLMQVMGMDTLVIEEHKTIYHAISEMKTAEEIERFVKNKIVYPMTDMIAERTESQFKTISDKMIHMIHHEYDTDLSLESVASRLHYNKNYLSSVFKKEYKQSFSEYLAIYRFDMAKKWLIETNLSVREISEKLQYNNSQNFIRSFRKIEGTTPGKYRELHRGDSFSF